MRRSTVPTTVPLGSLLELSPQNGYSPVCPSESTGKWVLGLSALDGSGLDLSGAKPAPINDPLVDKFFLKDGDFLISRSNTLDKVGRVGVFRGGLERCSYPDLMMRFRPNLSLVDDGYLETYLSSDEVITHIRRHATGTSGSMKKINQAVVESLPVVLLPIKDQKRAAKISRLWSSAAQAIDRLSAAKQLHYISEFASLSRRYRNQREHIGSFAREISERNRGENSARVLSVTNSQGFTLPEDQFGRRIASSDLSTYKIVRRGQYAYNPSRINVGSIARLDGWDMGVLSPMYVVFSLSEEKVDSDYFLHWLASSEARQRIRNSAQGSVRETVSFGELAAISLPLPERKQQQKIGEYLNALRAEIVLLGKQAESLRLQKRGLMRKLLTGRWPVELMATEVV